MPSEPTLSTELVPSSPSPAAGSGPSVHPLSAQSGLGIWLAATLIIATVLLLPGWIGALIAPLPDYALTLHSERPCLLCGPEVTTQKTLAADQLVDLQLRPQGPVAGPTFLHLYLRHGGELRRVFAFAERADDGSLRLRGRAREVLDLRGDEHGPIELLWSVSRSPLPLAALPGFSPRSGADFRPLHRLALHLTAY
ncbi:MAG TPA: hypothetical protein PKI03_12380 [Pseudomonadota bacterium]|nr:hypothetical protein [Pseudomonadota bacterium]